MSVTPRATIVIVNYNTRDLLRQCLASLRAHAPMYPVVVVDNASTDDSAIMVEGEFPEVTLLCNPQNIGFGAANNRAVARVKTEFTMLLNSDARVEDDVIAASARTLDEHPEGGLVGPRLKWPDGTIQRSARRFPSARRSLRNALALQDAIPSALTEADYVDGAAALVRTRALRGVKGFDERFFLYAEDADLCRRLKLAGWRIFYDPRVHAVHVGGGSTTRGSAEDDRRRWEALALYATIHFGPAQYAAFVIARALELVRQTVTSAARAALQGDRVALEKCKTALRHLRWHPGYFQCAALEQRMRCNPPARLPAGAIDEPSP
jgi:GT2 family glycosyltransferase